MSESPAPGSLPPEAVVTVRGEAQIEVPPDRASLGFTLHATGDSAERVRGQLAEGSSRVAEVLAEFAAALERSGTTGLHVSPVFNSRTPTRITGYTGTFSSQIVISDLEALSPLLLALTRLPQSQVDGPWWSLRPDHPAFREVRLAAIAEARTRAEDYAAAFGATVARLIEVSDLEGGFAPVPRAMRAFAGMEMASDAAFEFEPTLQTVSGQVSVRFALAGATV